MNKLAVTLVELGLVGAPLTAVAGAGGYLLGKNKKDPSLGKAIGGSTLATAGVLPAAGLAGMMAHPVGSPLTVGVPLMAAVASYLVAKKRTPDTRKK